MRAALTRHLFDTQGHTTTSTQVDLLSTIRSNPMDPNPAAALCALWWILPLGIIGALFIHLITPPDNNK